MAQEKRHGPERARHEAGRGEIISPRMRIVREGYPFIFGCLAGGGFFTAGGIGFQNALLSGLSVPFFIGAAFCIYFFRDPFRAIPAGDRWILSPADGKILEIVEEKE